MMTVYLVVSCDSSKPEVTVICAITGSIDIHVYDDWHHMLSTCQFLDDDRIFVKIDYSGR